MQRPTGWRVLGYVCSSVLLLGVLACGDSAALDPADPGSDASAQTVGVLGESLDLAQAGVPMRFADCRLYESEDLGIVAEGEARFRGANASMDYTATIEIRENGAALGNSPVPITLAAGGKEAENVTNVDELVISRQHLPHGESVIVANYRVFNVSGSPTDLYEMSIRLDEGAVNVVWGACTIKFL